MSLTTLSDPAHETAIPLVDVEPMSTDEEGLYEIINGERVEKIMGAREIGVACQLHAALSVFTKPELGRAAMEMLHDFGADFENNRRPGVSFVSYARWPKDRAVPASNAWGVVPNLAVEVVSRTNTAQEILEKVQEYFQAGVERVWVIYPSVRQVHAFQSPVENIILKDQDQLEDNHLFPGWKMPAAELFRF